MSISVFSQNVQTDASTYTPQQLIENILINSSCITNVVVTNVVGGNFGGAEKSYGYFNASGTTFPISEGLVLTTGKLSNVDGPNSTLSDDDVTNWNGDADLETMLNESNTTNATIIEFEFTSVSNQISFNYIFASEEYQENNANTCIYSDLFGFLIRPTNSSQYTNIALVPNTNIPVKVTTVHPDIPNGCSAQNEYYFGSWNNASAPINFNGQTKVLTAKADVTPNERYHVKLVIADEQNYRYDSAVFLEAGSFQSTIDLGEDRLLATNNPLCFNETLELDAFTAGNNVTYKWFKNGSEIIGETSSKYTVQNDGVYKVEVVLNGSCVSYGEITVEKSEDINTRGNYLNLCDDDNDGLTFFDLHLADPFYGDMTGLTVVNFFLTPEKADNNQDPIPNPSVFFNTVPNQVVYARIENQFGCHKVEPLVLDSNNSSLSFSEFDICDDNFDGIATFNLDELRTLIKPEVSSTATISFFESYNDAAYHQNELPDNFENTTPNSQEIWVKAQNIFCEILTTITLNVYSKPELQENEEQLYCLNTLPQKMTLNAGLINALPTDSYTYKWQKDGVDLGLNQNEIEIDEAGNYIVRVTNQNNCFSERTIQVNTSESAKIDNIEIENNLDLTSNITLTVSGIGEYEFALDDGIFQTDNTFLNVSIGSHTISVKDLNGCDTILEKIVVFGIPKFFTPNNDGKNDTWNPFGISTSENPITNVYVFDRFGKLLAELNPQSNGWNGFANAKQMPSADYWYKIIFQNGETLRGHFALIR
ncbi:MAG: choice-of-anchor L domain-containing protein [Lutibacter sp.]|uniref:choice-of-anchor L domain-containing protein n=1 Tax=Lutibacter sp. TaxID=1925666 RepID=UPI00299DEF26|nr:choice-of-anchor L domain-containing protein [Lutibacter sp.]MDX1830067.1 choice-of-anchor L domain-containing protein [Lutibacter sp.]